MIRKVEHPLFSFTVPDTFDEQVLSEIIALARSTSIPHKVQPHFVRLNLEEVMDLDSDEIKGATLAEKMVHYYLDEESQDNISEVEELLVDGNKTLAVSAKVTSTVLEKEYNLHYLFGAIFLDDSDFISFLAIHEITADGLLEDWTMETLKSVKADTDAAARKAAYETYENRFFNLVSDSGEEEKERVEEEAKKKAFVDVEIPKDGKDVFRIDAFDFEFISEETNSSIAKFSRELQVVLKAKTSSIKKAVAHKLLDDYPKDGMVTLTIPAKGIHDKGIPTGQLYFEDGNTNAPLFLHARIAGVDYGLQFTGSLTYDSGWVLLKGELTKSYDDLAFPVHIAKRLDVSKLQWQDYQFTSMEETATAEPSEVRFLHLTNPEFTKLPDAIFTFKNLEELTISQNSHNWENEKLPFAELPDAIGQLEKLKKISINGSSLKTLPESISQLKELEQLSVNTSLLTSVPKGLWLLPKLKFLWLSNNKLTTISEIIDLPLLENISIDINEFKTLPDALAKQPKLVKIDMQGNPLESLPDVFNIIKEIGLAMEDKLRLLDFSYIGADGTGLAKWNDTVFWAQNDADLLPEIQSIIKENKLEEHAKALKSMVKKAIGFSHVGEEDYNTLGNHRFGGMPDLPQSIPYPRFSDNWRDDKKDYVYEFIGQINCAEIAYLQDYLPRTGMLFFFLETIHNVYGGENSPAKVIYVEDTAGLASGKRFQLSTDDYFEMYDPVYAPFKVKASKMNSVPSFYAAYVNKHLFLGEAKKLKDEKQLLDDLYDAFERPINEKNDFQYAVNNHGFTQHEAPELQASLSKKGNPQDWVILLTVTSAGDMQWGDAGDLFFVIHKSDLEKCDFSNVFVTMESS